MKKIIIVFLLITTINYAQKHPVELLNTKDDTSFTLSAKNNTSTQQEITVTLTIENLTGYKKPITRLVPANSTIEIAKLNFIKGKRSSYSSRYTYVAKPTAEELAFQKKKLNEKAVTEVGDINKGIVVFSKDGCTRCHYVTSYMLDNNIDFKFLNTTENKDYNRLMWQILRAESSFSANTKSITMPVVLVNGKVSYNMKDLHKFVKGLKN